MDFSLHVVESVSYDYNFSLMICANGGIVNSTRSL